MTTLQFKIHRILLVILVFCLAICLRALHLETIQRERLAKEAEKPKTRTLFQRANRGTIRDRFGIPLAINRICYNAAIYYNQIIQIPAIQWKSSRDGKRVRTFPRKEYIRNLSKALASILHENEERIEDLIHAKASLFPNIPFILKSKISEGEYYTLKGMEKDFPGIFAEIGSERFYPLHKVGCHILGTVGPISQKKYTEIIEESAELQEIIRSYEEEEIVSLPKGYTSIEEVYNRLSEIKEKAYTLNDFVGKSGIEAEFEESLRGFFGKNRLEMDQKGRIVREIPGGKIPIAGQQVTLSISAELQQFAEELLAQNEKFREGRSVGVDPLDKQRKVQKQPWIKGGAIVAIDPKSGEVLALASFPRFDPNDFVQKTKRVYTWLENENF
ncbi:MAG: hypothetical protein FJZ64_00195, partial [Chlamydiae bacterium]|nr:hypothetical protein [Chlamydiota bacterium]